MAFKKLPVEANTRMKLAYLLLTLFAALPLAAQGPAPDVSLDGTWETGLNRHYTAMSIVPGLPQDPAHASPGTLWYRRTISLPAGTWSQATLILKGARFHPEVYVDGVQVASSEGGMAPIALPLGTAAAPGRTILLEIALHSLNDLSKQDASAVPGADLWRTDISSGLWDDVTLHFAGADRLTRLTPFTDFPHRRLRLQWQSAIAAPGTTLHVELQDTQGRTLASADSPHELALPVSIEPWSPLHPTLYQLHVQLRRAGVTLDEQQFTWAFKSFETHDRTFFLNGKPIVLLGGTVVWHRFLRTPGAAEVAFDPQWFQQNITTRLKSYGANTLRWHLGLPPERLLDLCDREGLMVQLEWPFFHGIAASGPSMQAQWTAWLDVAMRHPSVVIVHPWNETGDPVALRNAWQALDAILPNYPPLVFAHRDTVHIHKYWWSLFENLGLYYDSAAQFDKTAMVDEFGGNYLDWNGDPGGYPSTRESFLRFLGTTSTTAGRLEFHAESNARVAEYWRRIGAAGILPFCILGGPQDGSSWFLGTLHDPRAMPVWDALAAAFSPVSLSLDVWDRNYTSAQKTDLPLFLFNDSDLSTTLQVEVRIIDPATGAILVRSPFERTLSAHTRSQVAVPVALPAKPGDYQLQAVLLNPPAEVKHPVVSSWDVRVLAPILPKNLAGAAIGIAEDEAELRTFLQQNGLQPVPLSDPRARLIAGSSATWASLPAKRAQLQAALDRGVSVVLLDAGPRDLGEGYRKTDLGNLEGAPIVRDPYVQEVELMHGVHATFRQVAEPESHIQYAPANHVLWYNLPQQATWLWNGLRGGLVAPAADMEVSGLSRPALLAQWTQHGADAQAISSGQPYFAYEFFGYYAFSAQASDKPTQDALRARVRLLAEDAPALKDAINPNGPIRQIDLAGTYSLAATAQATSLDPLSTCGKNLTRAEIVELAFGPNRGRLILSQALTAGRLIRGHHEPGPYGIRYDPATEQFTLNMLSEGLK